MAVLLSPVGGVAAQFFNNDGVPLSGGLINTYLAGTNTPVATYTTNAGNVAHSNPIVLDSAGRVPGGEIWLTDGISYKFVLKDSTGALIATYDNIVGINSNFVAYTSQQEIQTATAGQTVFNLTTIQYQPATNNLSVFVDGVNQYGPGAQYAFVETDSDTVTFASGLHVGASVKFTTASPVASNATDAENVSYTPPFAGSVTTNVELKLAQTVSIEDFGAVGDGVTNDTAAIQAAIDSLGVAGGTVLIPNGMKCVIDNNLNIKANITLKGPMSFVGSPQNNASYPYATKSAIILNSSATINCYGGAGIDGCLIYRKGMVFPSINGETSFAGTAVTILYDDAFVFNSMILGFATAIYGSDCQRTRIDKTNIDCSAGIYLKNVFDVPYISNIHLWPFTTVGQSPSSTAHRSGSAIKIENADWPKITDCFSYGYYRGLHLVDTDDADVLSFSADGTQTFSGSIGIVVEGTAPTVSPIKRSGLRNKFTSCQTSSQDTGVYVATPNGAPYTAAFVNCRFSTSAIRDAWVNSGNGTFVACLFEASPYGVTISNASSKVITTECVFDITTAPFQITVANSKTVEQNNNYNGFAQSIASTNLQLPIIPSASPLVIAPEVTVIDVSGSTGFNAINYSWAGRQLTIIFSGTMTLTSGSGPHSLNLAGGTFSAIPGSTLTIVANNNNWFEVARKV